MSKPKLFGHLGKGNRPGRGNRVVDSNVGQDLDGKPL